jgi:hypothetical protein
MVCTVRIICIYAYSVFLVKKLKNKRLPRDVYSSYSYCAS